MNNPITALAAALVLGLTAGAARAQIEISEWMYNGAGPTGEYVELTNMGTAVVDFTGWSFDDSSRTPGSFSLSSLGLVAAGQSVLIAEASAAAFRSAWSLPASVRIAELNSNNLGRSDEINIYNAAGTLVDRMTYNDQGFAGTVRAQNFSANPLTLADLQTTTASANWVLASVGDGFGSTTSTLGDIGNPGSFVLSPVPEPASWALLLAGVGLMAARIRRRTGHGA